VTGVFFEVRRDGLDRRGEVGSDRHLDFIGLGAAEGEHRDKAGQASRGET
jgi:hypothetical protein